MNPRRTASPHEKSSPCHFRCRRKNRRHVPHSLHCHAHVQEKRIRAQQRKVTAQPHQVTSSEHGRNRHRIEAQGHCHGRSWCFAACLAMKRPSSFCDSEPRTGGPVTLSAVLPWSCLCPRHLGCSHCYKSCSELVSSGDAWTLDGRFLLFLALYRPLPVNCTSTRKPSKEPTGERALRRTCSKMLPNCSAPSFGCTRQHLLLRLHPHPCHGLESCRHGAAHTGTPTASIPSSIAMNT